MYYGLIEDCDIANGVGCRVTLFVSGCRNHCKGCFQPQTWNFKYGKEFTKDTEDKIMRLLNRPFIRGLSLLGGDPMEPENQKVLLPMLQRIKKELPNKDIWCYTGYTWENLNTNMLPYIDVLIDGPFILERKNLTLQFRGSENQRIINVQDSLKTGKLIPWQLTKKERPLNHTTILFNHYTMP